MSPTTSANAALSPQSRAERRWPSSVADAVEHDEGAEGDEGQDDRVGPTGSQFQHPGGDDREHEDEKARGALPGVGRHSSGHYPTRPRRCWGPCHGAERQRYTEQAHHRRAILRSRPSLAGAVAVVVWLSSTLAGAQAPAPPRKVNAPHVTVEVISSRRGVEPGRHAARAAVHPRAGLAPLLAEPRGLG